MNRKPIHKRLSYTEFHQQQGDLGFQVFHKSSELSICKDGDISL